MGNPENSNKTQSPLMQQYWEIKNQHSDKILLYRMGDFYEIFFDDAIKAAPILNIALTSRNKSQGQDVPMCGVPYHSIGPQINKLLAVGIKVAICDQVENPQTAKGIVKRAVTRVVTPGMVYDPETLDSSTSLFVAGVVKWGEANFSLAVLDASTGEFLTDDDLSRGELADSLQKFNVKEILIEDEKHLPFQSNSVANVMGYSVANGAANAVVTLRKRLKDENTDQYLLRYVRETQGDDIIQVVRPPEKVQRNSLKLSPTTLRHLEIFRRTDGEETPTLYSTVNLTKTPMGARLLRKRLATPFGELADIVQSQETTIFFVRQEDLRKDLRLRLIQIGDLERKVARLSNPLCNSRDLRALAASVKSATEIFENPDVTRLFLTSSSGIMSRDNRELKGPRILSDKILSTLQDELPHSTKEGGMIRPGINSVLDEYVELSTHAQTKLSELENRERQNTGIQSLKVKYNSVFGYSFEVTKANLEKVPGHFVRRQTLAQGERYITQELSELENKILSSQQKRCDLENQIFLELKQESLAQARGLLALCSRIGSLDLVLSWAQLAVERNFCRPTFQDEGIELKDSRHPVLEQCGSETFIPNDIILNQGHCLLLTGPNMAGKSTLMRQVAISTILAHCGSFISASAARLPLVDQIFTRIGANDNLSLGLSTFMVEMTETAAIVKNATARSLVILDEIGRGTSTFDGMSLAQAVLEYFLKNVKSYTFFATHYHELTDLAFQWREIVTGHMTIKEYRGELHFLRKLRPGPANRSYGIEVARAAGLPQELTARAREILNGLDAKGKELGHRQLSFLENPAAKTIEQVDPVEEFSGLSPNLVSELITEFQTLEVDRLTPLEALNKLSHFKKAFQEAHSIE